MYSPVWLSWLPFNFIYPDSYLKLCTYCCLKIQPALFTRVMHNVIFIGGWNYSHSLRTCKWSQNRQVLVSPLLKDCPGSNSKLFPHYIVQADIFKLSHLSKWLTSSFFFHLFLKEHFPQPLKRFTAQTVHGSRVFMHQVLECVCGCAAGARIPRNPIITPSMKCPRWSDYNNEEETVKWDWFYITLTDPHLLIILSKGCAHGIFVDCLHNTNDFSIAVADGHAKDGLCLISC